MNRFAHLLRRNVVLCLVVATAAICAQSANAQPRLLKKANGADPLRPGAIVRHGGGLMMLPDWLTVEPVARQPAPDQPGGPDTAVEDDDDAIEADPHAVADDRAGQFADRWRGRISDDAFNRRVFGRLDVTAAWQQLDERLRSEIRSLDNTYGFTSSQKQKLLVAGRGDMKRLFDRIQERRLKLTSRVAIDVESVGDLSRDFSEATGGISANIRSGPFGRGSLFAKTLNRTITLDQVAEYEKRKQEGAVVTHSWDLRVR
jgi:hypothetical protein